MQPEIKFRPQNFMVTGDHSCEFEHGPACDDHHSICLKLAAGVVQESKSSEARLS